MGGSESHGSSFGANEETEEADVSPAKDEEEEPDADAMLAADESWVESRAADRLVENERIASNPQLYGRGEYGFRSYQDDMNEQITEPPLDAATPTPESKIEADELTEADVLVPEGEDGSWIPFKK